MKIIQIWKGYNIRKKSAQMPQLKKKTENVKKYNTNTKFKKK